MGLRGGRGKWTGFSLCPERRFENETKMYSPILLMSEAARLPASFCACASRSCGHVESCGGGLDPDAALRLDCGWRYNWQFGFPDQESQPTLHGENREISVGQGRIFSTAGHSHTTWDYWAVATSEMLLSSWANLAASAPRWTNDITQSRFSCPFSRFLAESSAQLLFWGL